MFTEIDEQGDGMVAVVSRTVADRYFAGESPIGKQVDGLGVHWKAIVGAVEDTRNDGLRNPTRPEIYLPLTGHKPLGGGVTRNNGLNIAIRTAGDPAIAATVLRGHLRDIDRALLANVRPMNEQWADLQAGPRCQALIFSGFAGLAICLAATGVYGVLAHAVVLRRREIGMRLALGAQSADVQRMIVREAVLLALGGIALGIAGALAGSRAITTLLYHVNPTDPLTLVAAAVLLMLLAIAASVVPARRAAREDPAQTLRAE